jgi:hypothetical protein
MIIMKKFLILGIAVLATVAVSAQSDRYVKAMEANVVAIDTTHTVEGLAELANNFQRIADAEKTQWLPYYYAALSNVMSGFMMPPGSVDKTDPLADKAESLLQKAETLNNSVTGDLKSKNASEINIVKKMISNLRMMADPMNRYQTYGPIGKEALDKAKSLYPENPRVPMLEGQDLFYTPEEFGGSKAQAKLLFEESMKRFESAKPASSIDPQWGLSQVKYFHSLCK